MYTNYMYLIWYVLQYSFNCNKLTAKKLQNLLFNNYCPEQNTSAFHNYMYNDLE